jgi:hypothetical protein
MDARYSIYFAGELLDGHDRATVRAGLAKLFNADEATLDKLFSGKAQMIKRGCDKATALKYKQAMERTGARPIIRDEASGETPAVEQPEPAKPVSAAEKIAALAAAPDEGAYRADTSVATANAPEVPAADSSAMNLAPTGADVLRPDERTEVAEADIEPDERTEVAEADIDTSSLVVDETAQRLSDEPPPPPPAPDTSHLGMGEVGDTIPGLDTGPAPVTPDTESISLVWTPDRHQSHPIRKASAWRRRARISLTARGRSRRHRRWICRAWNWHRRAAMYWMSSTANARRQTPPTRITSAWRNERSGQIYPHLQARIIVFQFQAPVMILGYRLGQAETQAVAGLFAAAGFDPVEAPKHILPFTRRDTRPGITDNHEVPSLLSRRQLLQ